MGPVATKLLHLIRRRPFIALTLGYVALLIVLDCRGFFIPPPGNFTPLEQSAIAGRISNPPEERNNKVSFVLSDPAIDGKQTHCRLLVTCFSPWEHYEAGDIVSLNGKIQQPPEQRNPGSFDYGTYLRRQGISVIVYTPHAAKTGKHPLPFYRSLALAVRENILATIDDNLPAEQAHILAPMLIGEKAGLTEEEKQAFTDAGVMHVLTSLYSGKQERLGGLLVEGSMTSSLYRRY